MKYSPYSHSRLDSFRHCPMKFKLQYIDKVKTPFVTNLALYRGSFFHECLEYNDDRPDFKTNEVFTQEEKDKVIVLVHEFRKGHLWKEITSHDYINELEFGFKINENNLIDCNYYDKSAWIRGAIDVHWWEDNKVYVQDYKSGKDKSKDTKYFTNDQMVTYAVWFFTKYPELQEVETAFIYVEHNTERHETFYREDYSKLVKQLFDDTKNCENGERYKKVVGPLCGYCDFKTYGHCSGEIDTEDLTGFTGLDF